MLNSKTRFLCFLMGLPIVVFGQTFTGRISDSQNATPLPYASIGIKGKSIGGIADSDGYFHINIANASATDTIVVSYLGYHSKTLVKRDVMQSQ